MSTSPAPPVTTAAAQCTAPLHLPRLTVDMLSVRCFVATKRPRLFGWTGVGKVAAAGTIMVPIAASSGRRLGADGHPAESRIAARACDVSDIEHAPRAREEVAVAPPAAHVGQQDGRAGCACAPEDPLSARGRAHSRPPAEASRCSSHPKGDDQTER